MKFKNREEIKNILEMNIDKAEKRNLIANIKNIKTDLGRVITADRELEIEVGQEWNNLGKSTSWTNTKVYNENFKPELGGEIEYFLTVEDVEGYEVQYLNFDILFDTLSEEMEEEEAEALAEEISEDETYIELMNVLGSDADMTNEAEVLVPSETKFEIVAIEDNRRDMGYIEVILKEIK